MRGQISQSGGNSGAIAAALLLALPPRPPPPPARATRRGTAALTAVSALGTGGGGLVDGSPLVRWQPPGAPVKVPRYDGSSR
jgi:hypothetical protein